MSLNTTLELSNETSKKSELQLANNVLDFPLGLMGFPELKEMEIVYNKEELPFMHLRQTKPDGLEFLVITPYGLIPDYTVVISDLDLDFLEIESADNLLLFNIATVKHEPKQEVTVNLVGPVAINKKTGRAKQIVINNYQDYTARYPLFREGE